MDAVAGVCMGTGRINRLLQPEEDQTLEHEKCLGEVGQPSADLTGKDEGAEEME